MAVLGTALAKEILGFDDANKAFRPWRDTTQDLFMYGMVVLGKYIVLLNYFAIPYSNDKSNLCVFYTNTFKYIDISLLIIERSHSCSSCYD